MTTIKLKRGDTAPFLRYDLPAGTDLTDAAVTFTMAERPGAAPVIIDRPARIVDVSPPIIEYVWRPGDTALSGTFRGEFKVTYPDGRWATFPQTGYVVVTIEQSLTANAGPSVPPDLPVLSVIGAAVETGEDVASGAATLAPLPVTATGAATETGSDTASGAAALGAPPVQIGGVTVGAQGTPGTIYWGYQLVDGDDFDTADQFLTPTSHDGTYMTTRNYGVQSGAPRYLRGAASLGGYEADPWHSGFKDAGRGAVPASFADTIVVSDGSIKLKSRRATSAEKSIMGDLSAKNNVSSMIHMGRRNMMRAPCIAEMRLRFPRALSSWNQWHPTFWLIQSQPGNGWDGLELDCEGFTQQFQFNRNTWSNGVGAYGPTLGTTAAVSATDFRTYAFEILQVSGAWRVRLWEEGNLVAEGSPDYGGNAFDPTRPFHLMMTNHILQSGLTQSVFDGAGSAGAVIDCDWWRAWKPTAATFRKPMQRPVQLMTAFDTPFSFDLATPQALWGADVIADVIEMLPNEDNSPAQPWVRGLLPPSVTRAGNTLAGRIADQPGRLILARSVTPAPGDGCVPQPITLCVGPTIRTSALTYTEGQAFSFDAYAAVDCGDLHMGKAVTVTGLPAWASFNPTTGLVTGTPTNTGNSSFTVSGTNAVGQSASRQITLTRVAPAQQPPAGSAAAYETWTGPGWFDFSDTATITTSGGNISTVANKRTGGTSLTREGATAVTSAAAAQNGRAMARFARSATDPARLVASASAEISRVSQGNDKPFTVITVYTPTDANTGFVWSWSDFPGSNQAQNIALVRRAASASSARREQTGLVNNDASWGSGQVANAPRIVAVVHTGTAVTVWDTSLTKAVDLTAQDTAAFNTNLVFRIGAALTASATTFGQTACAMDVGEVIVEARAVPDADVQQAITDLAAKWGITLA